MEGDEVVDRAADADTGRAVRVAAVPAAATDGMDRDGALARNRRSQPRLSNTRQHQGDGVRVVRERARAFRVQPKGRRVGPATRSRVRRA